MLKYRILPVAYALAAFMVLYAVFAALFEPRGRLLPADWRVVSSTVETLSGTLSIPWYHRGREPSALAVESNASWNRGDLLMIPKISGEVLKVYSDDMLLFQAGSDLQSGNIWLRYFTIRLPGEGEHRLRLEITAQYDIGIEVTPWIIPEAGNTFFLFWVELLVNRVYILTLGMSFVLAILLLLYSFARSDIRPTFLFLSVALVLSGMFFQELVFRETTGSVAAALWLKKINLASGYTSFWFLAAAMEYFYFRRFSAAKILLAITLISDIIILTQAERYDISNTNHVTFLMSMANIAWLYYMVLVKKERIMIFIVSIFIFCALYTFLNVVLVFAPIYFFHLALISVQIVVSIYVLNEYLRIHEEFFIVSHKSRHDPLTGAWNRYAFEELKDTSEGYVVLVDLNRFKELNDSRGHDFGDRVLIQLVKSIKEHLEAEEKVIRFGGDEFVILLQREPGEVMPQIEHSFEKNMNSHDVSFSWGGEKINGSCEAAMKLADEKMYTDKICRRQGDAVSGSR